MATADSHTTADEQSTTVTAAGQTVAQTAIGDFGTVSLIETTDDGDVIYPDEVAGYRRQESKYNSRTVFTAPIGVEQTRTGCFQEQQYMVAIHSPTGDDHYNVGVQIGESFSSWDGYGIMATGETEREAAEKAVEFMQTYPAPGVDQLYRPGEIDRNPCAPRVIGKQADRIREGSRVYVDGLPPAQAVRELDSSETRLMGGTVWECEPMKRSTQTFHLYVEDSYSKPEVAYAGSLTDYKARTHAEHLTVDNEENLRDCINWSLYQWLKDRQGETVIRQTSDTTFDVIEVTELRDGHLNPSSDKGLDPTSHRPSGTVIGEDIDAGNWFDNEVELPTGRYRVVESGVAQASDMYAGNVIVDANEWNAADLFAPTDDQAVDSLKAAPSNVLTANRDGLSRSDSVTDITGVGSATADMFWHDNVGDLYDIGFPGVYIPNQYTEQAIADLYSLPDYLQAADAARAVVGVLGGVAFDDDGERIGSAASMISDTLNPDDMAYGWLGNYHEYRIKKEYVPSWVTDNNSPEAVGAGAITAPDVEEAADTAGLNDPKPATGIRQHPNNDDLVAVITDNRAIEVAKKPLKVMATIANVDLGSVANHDDSENQITVLEYEHGGGVLVLNNTKTPFNAVIDTEGKVSPEQL